MDIDHSRGRGRSIPAGGPTGHAGSEPGSPVSRARLPEGPPGLRRRSASAESAGISPERNEGLASAARRRSTTLPASPARPGVSFLDPEWLRRQGDIRAVLDPLASFAGEPGADSFGTWVGRMVREVSAWHIPHVPASMHALVVRMGRDTDFRAECFGIARDALGHCGDRVLAGYNHMQAALLASRAVAGELSTPGLYAASIRLFNRHALEAFAVEHAYGARQGDEGLEVALYLEAYLGYRLALPPSAPMNDAESARIRASLGDAVLAQAVAHVQALHREAGSHGLQAFLAGLGDVEFNAWAEHLRRKFPRHFDKLNRKVSRRLEARASELGGTAAAREQAGVECKEHWARLSIGMVARLTGRILPGIGTDVRALERAGTRRGRLVGRLEALFQSAAGCLPPLPGARPVGGTGTPVPSARRSAQ